MTHRDWPWATRVLHAGLVLTVSANLLVSQIMSEPDEDGNVLGKWFFEFHEIIGLSALVIVLLHWFWSLASYRDGNLTHLFPWLFEGMDQVRDDIKGLAKGKLPQGGAARGGLPGLLHGFGLLAVTGITLSGAIYYFSEPNLYGESLLQEGSEELHEFFAGLVWFYWLAHGGIAMLHLVAGHTYVKDMFRWSTNRRSRMYQLKSSADDRGRGTQHTAK